MRRSWVVAAAVAFVLGMVAVRWDARTGFTSLLRFGESAQRPRIPALAGVRIATVPGIGYDGQAYAQLAVSPDVRDPAVRAALDSAPYRARRILLILSAHVLGMGSPSFTLEVYAVQNVVLWLALGWLLWRELSPVPVDRAAAAWCCCMLSLGALDSIRMGLVDLAPVVFLAWGIRRLRSGRPGSAVVAFAFAGLSRETSLVGGGFLTGPPRGRPRWLQMSSGALRWAVAAAPVLAWAAWLHWNIPGSGAPIRGNLDWPVSAFARSCATCARHLAAGDFDTRYVFGLLGGLGLAFQSAWLLARPQWSEPWWRAGAGTAILFWFLGGAVWHGYWAVARVALPMTVAFNLLSPRDRWFWMRLSAANLPLLVHGIWRMLP